MFRGLASIPMLVSRSCACSVLFPRHRVALDEREGGSAEEQKKFKASHKHLFTRKDENGKKRSENI
jgi:hypothetical protein